MLYIGFHIFDHETIISTEIALKLLGYRTKYILNPIDSNFAHRIKHIYVYARGGWVIGRSIDRSIED